MDAWILSWMPGQGTGFHDHYISSVGLCVACGSVREDLLVYGAAPSPGPQGGRLAPGRPRLHPPRHARRRPARRDRARLLAAARLGRPVPARSGRRRSSVRCDPGATSSRSSCSPRARSSTCSSGSEPSSALPARPPTRRTSSSTCSTRTAVATGARKRAGRRPSRRRLARCSPHLGRRRRRRRQRRLRCSSGALQSKDTWPGALDVAVGGHLRAGETLAEAVREAEEEIGLARHARRTRPARPPLRAQRLRAATTRCRRSSPCAPTCRSASTGCTRTRSTRSCRVPLDAAIELFDGRARRSPASSCAAVTSPRRRSRSRSPGSPRASAAAIPPSRSRGLREVLAGGCRSRSSCGASSCPSTATGVADGDRAAARMSARSPARCTSGRSIPGRVDFSRCAQGSASRRPTHSDRADPEPPADERVERDPAGDDVAPRLLPGQIEPRRAPPPRRE